MDDKLQELLGNLDAAEKAFHRMPYRKRKAASRALRAVRKARERLIEYLDGSEWPEQADWLRRNDYRIDRDDQGVFTLVHDPLPW